MISVYLLVLVSLRLHTLRAPLIISARLLTHIHTLMFTVVCVCVLLLLLIVWFLATHVENKYPYKNTFIVVSNNERLFRHDR